MGKPLPPAASPADGKPPSGDQANAYVSGTFTAAGQVSRPFAFYGRFNVAIWPVVNTALTTTAATATSATVASGTNIAAGQTIISANVPLGATVATKSTTTISIGGLTATQIAEIIGGTDNNAVFVGTAAGADATIQLEKSFDGGATWIAANIQNTVGTQAVFHIASGNINGPVDFWIEEPEREVAYRLNVTAYSSGTINYRLSATGGAATTWMPK